MEKDILVAGASGATGKQLVEQLLHQGQNVRVIVRTTSKIPDSWNDNDKLAIIRANISEISLDEMANHVKGCQGIASCLGHNLTLKGMFGKPRKLVTDAVALLYAAVRENSPESPVRFVLMNTAGNRNLNEPDSAREKLVMSLIRRLVPPQSDNEKAAEFLRAKVDNKAMEWVVVRPDTLINQTTVTEYTLHASPTRSALFNPGKTSRINVGHFMARLLVEDDLWDQWKGQMPVIYNQN